MKYIILDDEGFIRKIRDEKYSTTNQSHFNEKSYKKAMDEMNTSKSYSLDQIVSIAKRRNINLDSIYFNRYDFAYAVNMICSIYLKLFGNDLERYVAMALLFLDDKNAPIGKAWKYYKAMK